MWSSGCSRRGDGGGLPPQSDAPGCAQGAHGAQRRHASSSGPSMSARSLGIGCGRCAETRWRAPAQRRVRRPPYPRVVRRAPTIRPANPRAMFSGFPPRRRPCSTRTARSSTKAWRSRARRSSWISCAPPARRPSSSPARARARAWRWRTGSETVGVPVPTVNVITARDLMLGAMVDARVPYDRFVVVEDSGDRARRRRLRTAPRPTCASPSSPTATSTSAERWRSSRSGCRGAALWIRRPTLHLRAVAAGAAAIRASAGRRSRGDPLAPLGGGAAAAEVRIFGRVSDGRRTSAWSWGASACRVRRRRVA